MAQEQVKSRDAAQTKRSPQPNGATKHDVSMANDDEVQQRRPTSFAKFIRDIIIVVVLLGGGGFTYWKHIVTKGKLSDLALKANDKLQKDDLESLKDAEAL